MNPKVEEFNLSYCSLDTAKATAIAKELPRFTAIKKFGFTGVDGLTWDPEADVWSLLLAAMTPKVEEFNFRYCIVDTAQATAIAKELPRFKDVKKFDLSGNNRLEADGWAALLAGMSPGVEDFNFSRCFDLENGPATFTAIAKQLPRFTAIKNLDLSGNKGIRTDDWAVLRAAAPAARFLTHIEVLTEEERRRGLSFFHS
eukprot:gnl/MRDRNA2_/MRDRNA2_84756_c0_seq3.p1 gnl/MRDRNA2_/MRDRNA2_84756_c0~~gnl/MRDRNA2_/MRDRNA2_84756_c0_seq3.p1  ORF type:complete len:223 (+),score=54.37 gnl/MRDRNA2_/MRDRNA2_84756_c0_seq3:72-671(+)